MGTPLPPEQRVIRLYTGRAEQPIRTIYLTAAQAAQARVILEDLVAVIHRGGAPEELRAVIQMDTLLGRIEVDILPLMEDLLFRATAAGEQVFAETLGVPPLDFAIFRRDAISAARTQVGELIQGIERGRINPLTGARTPGQLDIVRQLVSEGYEIGRTVPQTATLIRDVIGLDSRRAEALARYERELRDAGVQGKELEKLVAKEARKKLKSRSRAISQTETIRAASISQDMIWEAAVTNEQLNPDIYVQEWVPSPNACPVCQGLRAARARIGGDFPEPGGKGPPAHPWCKCHRRLRRA